MSIQFDYNFWTKRKNFKIKKNSKSQLCCDKYPFDRYLVTWNDVAVLNLLSDSES